MILNSYRPESSAMTDMSQASRLAIVPLINALLLSLDIERPFDQMMWMVDPSSLSENFSNLFDTSKVLIREIPIVTLGEHLPFKLNLSLTHANLELYKRVAVLN